MDFLSSSRFGSATYDTECMVHFCIFHERNEHLDTVNVVLCEIRRLKMASCVCFSLPLKNKWSMFSQNLYVPVIFHDYISKLGEHIPPSLEGYKNLKIYLTFFPYWLIVSQVYIALFSQFFFQCEPFGFQIRGPSNLEFDQKVIGSVMRKCNKAFCAGPQTQRGLAILKKAYTYRQNLSLNVFFPQVKV